MSAIHAGFFRTLFVDATDDDSPISARRWEQAVSGGAAVGVCRCSDGMLGGAPIQADSPTCLAWYPGRCGNGHERLAAGGRYH